MKITAVIITKNEEPNIRRCLDSLQKVADEIIVIDAMSTDKTEVICREYPNLIFVSRTWAGYAATKNYGNGLAKNPYILSIDADEVLSEKLRLEILENKPILRGGYSPVSDGEYLNDKPFFSDANHFSADIPLMICSTFNEQSPSRTDASLENVSLADVKEKIKSRFGDKSSEIVEAYAKNFPKARPIELWSMIVSNRKGAVAAADAKVSQKKAPVYVAWFGWQPPLFDNRMRAFHCADICFWFYNTDLMLTHTGGGKRPRALSDKMAKSLLNFMKTGNPNGGGLPKWNAYTSQNGETMILDDTSALVNDPDREARKTLM